MKICFNILLTLFSLSASCQTQEEQKFLDTLKMGGSYLIGKQMKEFECKTVTGEEYSNKDLKNKVTVINFWFEACAPCAAEVDALNNLYEKYKKEKKFQFLSFTFDPKENVIKFITKHNIKYPVIILSDDSCSILNFRKGFPSTIITDTMANIIYYHIGGPKVPKAAMEFIETNVYPIIEQEIKKM